MRAGKFLRVFPIFAACALTALAAAGSSVAAEPGARVNYHVRHPGVVLVAPAPRLKQLARMGTAAERFCHIARPHPAPAPNVAPIVSLEGRLGYGGNDKRVTPFDWGVTVYGAEAFCLKAPDAYANFMTLVTNWARADAMTEVEDDLVGSNTSVLFGLKRSLATLIPNWALIRNDPRTSDADRRLVDRWIKRLVNITDTNTGVTQPRTTRVVDCPANQRTSNCNNHRYLRDEVNIMWGALAGDDARFTKGIERFKVALRQMRADGSLPLETARGSRALWYQNYAVGMLVTIAEVAAQQGYDLYGMEKDGRSIHKAIAFLLDGINDPRIVLPYAKANFSPGPGLDWHEQDLRFTELRGRWHHMAWIEAYVKRFPRHPNTKQLRKELPGPFLDRPLISRIDGGMTSAYFATP